MKPSDNRLLYILGAGSILRRLADPSGILRAGQPSRLTFLRTEACPWTLYLSFPTGSGLKTTGELHRGNILISSMEILDGEQTETLRGTPAASAADFLRTAEPHPRKLTGMLSPPQEKSTQADMLGHMLERAFALTREALFYNIEGADARELFEGMRIDWSDEANAVLTTHRRLGRSRLLVRCTVDLHGISDRHVFLDKSLNAAQAVHCDCFSKGGNPSLATAFALLEKLETPGQKNLRKDMGRPGGVSQNKGL